MASKTTFNLADTQAIYQSFSGHAAQFKTQLEASLSEHQKNLVNLTAARKRLKYPNEPEYAQLKMPNQTEMEQAQGLYVGMYDPMLKEVVKTQMLVRFLTSLTMTTPEQIECDSRVKGIDLKKFETLQQERTDLEKQVTDLNKLETIIKGVFEKFKKELDEFCRLVGNSGQPFSIIGLGTNKLSSYDIPLPGAKKAADEGKDDGKPKRTSEEGKVDEKTNGSKDSSEGSPVVSKAGSKSPKTPSGPKGFMDTFWSVLTT